MITMADALAHVTLDQELSTPIYLQLAQQLESAIHAGHWRAEEALPSERALSDRLSISRVTARKALDVLLAQGLISRSHGSGTFITPRLEQPLSRLSSFSEMLRSKGFTPSSQWLSRELSEPTPEEVLRLGLSPRDHVARLKRLRRADGVVMAIEHSALPARFMPDPQAVGDSLYAWLDAENLSVVRALQHIQAVNASPEMAHLAGLEPGTAMLLMTRISYLADNTPIELTDTYCRNDYYDFVAELRR
ncbi:GntR family transcriptional regulator [Pseudomonas luteola]|uniref:GntR family transcriptional regulator n=1 Tax=Pseudomonas TaxID=286 RepID=UPI00388CF733